MSGTSCCGVQAGSCFCNVDWSKPLPAAKPRKMIGYCVCGCGVMVYEDDEIDPGECDD